MSSPQQAFAALFDGNDDPWGFRTRWYEARKRDLTLACLPEAQYRLAYEPGCANGELSAALAPRCDRLLVSDGVAAAVALARRRLAPFPHAEVFTAWVPDDWPGDRLAGLDLLVFSEFGFYLTMAQLDRLIDRTLESLSPTGTVLACHWRHEVKGFTLSGDAVHQRLNERLTSADLTRLLRHEEADFVLEVWSRDARSVATREGMT